MAFSDRTGKFPLDLICNSALSFRFYVFAVLLVLLNYNDKYFELGKPFVKQVPFISDKCQLFVKHLVFAMESQELFVVGFGQLFFCHFFKVFLFREMLHMR